MSLRLKLLLAVAPVVWLSIGVVAWTSNRVARSEFHEFLLFDGADRSDVDVSPLIAKLIELLSSSPSRESIQSTLDHSELVHHGHEVIFMGTENEISLRSAGMKDANLSFETPGLFRISWPDGRELFLPRARYERTLQGDTGMIHGRLIWCPIPGERRVKSEARAENFNLALDRGSTLIGLLAAVLALGIVYGVAHNATRPLRAMTRAVKRLPLGEFPDSIPTTSRDEVGDLARAFLSMTKTLEHLESERRRLISDISHEIRTPLTHLRSRLESAQDNLIPTDQKLVDSLHLDVMHLKHVVDDLQCLSLTDSDVLPMNPSTFDVRQEVFAVRTSFESDFHLKAIRLDVAVEDELVVLADSDRVRQVLRILLTNAIRYTPEGGTITIEGRRRDLHAEVTVTDTGPGLSPEALKFAFERFWRDDQARRRETGGTGLGLAIARRLVEFQGGTMSAYNEQDGGAAFIFSLPLSPGAAPKTF